MDWRAVIAQRQNISHPHFRTNRHTPVDEVVIGDGREDRHLVHQLQGALVKQQDPRRLLVSPPVTCPERREPQQGLGEPGGCDAVGAAGVLVLGGLGIGTGVRTRRSTVPIHEAKFKRT